MNTTQSIIVYRNPAEAALWEGGMILPLIVFMVVAVVLGALGLQVVERFSVRSTSAISQYIVLGVAIVLAGMAAYHFVI